MQSNYDIDRMVKSIAYKDAFRVYKQLDGILNEYVSLRAVIDLHVFNDGEEHKLIKLTGTIPIFYQGHHYNTPVDVWIPIQFPQIPPMCYVVAQQGMRIRDNHQHVDRMGAIYHSYLAQWNKHSTLKQLLTILANVFSAVPPLFAAPNSNPPHHHHQHHSHRRHSFHFKHHDHPNSNHESDRQKLERLVKAELQLIYDAENQKLQSLATQQVSVYIYCIKIKIDNKLIINRHRWMSIQKKSMNVSKR